jgi:hypothetical protein
MDYLIFTPIIAGVLRNAAGWVENSLKDGKVNAYEWGQLFATTVQVALIGFAAIAMGADPLVGAGAGILGSMAISTAKKVGTQV